MAILPLHPKEESILHDTLCDQAFTHASIQYSLCCAGLECQQLDASAINICISADTKLFPFSFLPFLLFLMNGLLHLSTCLCVLVCRLGLDECTAAGYLNNCMSQAPTVPAKLKFLRRLLRAGVDPNASDYDSRSALHTAASAGYLVGVSQCIFETYT